MHYSVLLPQSSHREVFQVTADELQASLSGLCLLKTQWTQGRRLGTAMVRPPCAVHTHSLKLVFLLVAATEKKEKTQLAILLKEGLTKCEHMVGRKSSPDGSLTHQLQIKESA